MNVLRYITSEILGEIWTKKVRGYIKAKIWGEIKKENCCRISRKILEILRNNDEYDMNIELLREFYQRKKRKH